MEIANLIEVDYNEMESNEEYYYYVSCQGIPYIFNRKLTTEESVYINNCHSVACKNCGLELMAIGNKQKIEKKSDELRG